MDNTQQYIRMSDCPEIQSKAIGHVMQSVSWDEYLGDGVYITSRGEYYTGNNIGKKEEYIIWLPRQDQLQGMITGNPCSILIQIGEEGQSNKWANEINTNSYEQLWLAVS